MRKDIGKKQLLRSGAVRLRTAFYRAHSSNARIGCDCGRRANGDEPQMARQVILVQEAVRKDAVFFPGKRMSEICNTSLNKMKVLSIVDQETQHWARLGVHR